jgi:DNA-binding NarL/FixJ family response regulator
MATRILIVDDHAAIRKVLRRHLEDEGDFSVVGEAVDGRDGVAKAEALLPDLVLMDVAMPELDGIEATRLICERLPQVKVLMLSIYNSSDHCLRAVRAGAHGYVLKESAALEVATAIRTIMSGQHFFGEGIDSPL